MEQQSTSKQHPSSSIKNTQISLQQQLKLSDSSPFQSCSIPSSDFSSISAFSTANVESFEEQLPRDPKAKAKAKAKVSRQQELYNLPQEPPLLSDKDSHSLCLTYKAVLAVASRNKNNMSSQKSGFKNNSASYRKELKQLGVYIETTIPKDIKDTVQEILNQSIKDSVKLTTMSAKYRTEILEIDSKGFDEVDMKNHTTPVVDFIKNLEITGMSTVKYTNWEPDLKPIPTESFSASGKRCVGRPTKKPNTR